MKRIKIVFAASLMLVICSCTDHNETPVYSDELTGKWLLTGTRISPGYPVPISPVPSVPVQVLELKSDSTVQSSVINMPEGASEFSVQYDTVFHVKGLFIYYAESPNYDAYYFTVRKDTLTLGHFGCFESCDLIFKRM